MDAVRLSQIRQLRQLAATACGELAFEISQYPDIADEEMRAAFNRHKRCCSDPVGAYADELFNDVGMITDIVGDRLYDLVHGNWQIPYKDVEAWNAAVDELAKQFPHMSTKLTNNLRREPPATATLGG